MTIDQYIDKAIVSIGHELSDFSEVDRKILRENIRSMVNNAIQQTSAGMTDTVIELHEGFYVYDVGDEILQITTANLNDNIDLTKSIVPPDQIVLP